MSLYVPWQGCTPRAWQAAALPLAQAAIMAQRDGVVQAIMGAGKSYLIRELCRWYDGPVVVAAPLVRLVDQLSADIEGSATWDGRGKTLARVIVACNPSLQTVPQRPNTLLIVDECHNTNNDQFDNALAALNPDRRIGFTATPFGPRDGDSLLRWSEMVYSYDFSDALRDKVIVPWRIVPHLGEEIPLDDACIELIRGSSGPGLANADSAADAESFAARLNDEGIEACAIHCRLPKGQYEERIAALLAGTYRCVVHVNMLSEGVNIPELRWLCARRKVQSRTRFAQEVGRVLRTCPGKEYAVIYDPQDLFSTMRVTSEAAVGGEAADEGYMQPDDFELLDKLPPEQRKKIIKKSTAMDKNRYFIRELGTAVSVVYHTTSASGTWRDDEPSANQLKALRSAATKFGSADVPRYAKLPLRVCYQMRKYLTKGEVSDMLGIMLALNARGWDPLIESLCPPPPEYTQDEEGFALKVQNA